MSPLKINLPILRSRPREVVLVPDQRFFVRSLPLTRGEDAPEVAAQVELGLELLAPFPLGQVFYGYWTRPGADRVLVFAAYRKRFSAEELEGWGEAEWVAPRFAALLAGEAPAPATTWILRAEGALTAVHFDDDSGVPAAVTVRELPVEAPEEAWEAAKGALIREMGDALHVEEFGEIEIDPGNPGDDEIVCRAQSRTARASVRVAESIDVRDSVELAGRRRARVRDRWMWRAMVAMIGLIVASGVAEAALFGTKIWQRDREALVAQQLPVVSEIETADQLVNRIHELSTERLRPFEMVNMIVGPLPESLVFERVQTQGLYTLLVDAYSSTLSDIESYRSALDALPGTVRVEVPQSDMSSGRAQFRIEVEFDPSFLKPSTEGGNEP